jgi:hypothetical protein
MKQTDQTQPKQKTLPLPPHVCVSVSGLHTYGTDFMVPTPTVADQTRSSSFPYRIHMPHKQHHKPPVFTKDFIVTQILLE